MRCFYLVAFAVVVAAYTLSLEVLVYLASFSDINDEEDGLLACGMTFALFGLLIPMMVEEIHDGLH